MVDGVTRAAVFDIGLRTAGLVMDREDGGLVECTGAVKL